jgi:hypothetical protein
MLLAMVSPASAAGWQATRVHGIVLSLEDGVWRDLASGADLPDRATVRALGKSRVEVAGEGVALFLHNGAATELSQRGPDVDLVLHAGSIDLSVVAGHVVRVTTAAGSMTLGEGRVRIWRDGDVTGIDDIAGNHEVFDAAGNCTRLSPGQTAHLAAAGVTIAPAGDS